MRGQLYKIWQFFAGHIFFVAAIFFCVVCFALISIPKTLFRENVLDILPAQDKIIGDAFEASKIFNRQNAVFFNIGCVSTGTGEQTSENFATAAEYLATQLSKIKGVEKLGLRYGVLDESVLTDLLSTYPLFFKESEFEKLTNPTKISNRLSNLKSKLGRIDGDLYKALMLRDPLGFFEILQGKFNFVQSSFPDFQIKNGYLYSGDGRNLLLIAQTDFLPTDSSRSSRFMEDVFNVEKDFKEKFPEIVVDISGGHRISADNAKLARENSLLCMGVSFGLIMLLCAFAFRRKYFFLIAPLPSILGVCVAFILLGFIYGELSAISIAFATIAIGVSIDYAIHILCAADKSCSHEDFFRRTQPLVKPIIVGAATTMIAFGIMFLIGSRGFVQFGLFGVIGVGVSAMSSIFLLPAFLAVFGRLDKGRGGSLKVESVENRVNIWVGKHSKIVVFVWIALIVAAWFGIQKLSFNGNVSAFSGVYPQTAKSTAIIKKIWAAAVEGSMVVVSSDTLERALSKNAEVLKLIGKSPEVLHFDAVGEECSSLKNLSKNRDEWNKYIAGEKLSEIQKNFSIAAKQLKISPSAFDEYFKRLNIPSNILPESVFLLQTPLKKHICKSADGWGISCGIVFAKDADIYGFISKLRQSVPEAMFADMNFLNAHIGKITKFWLAVFATLAAALVFCCLFVALRKLRLVACAVIPVGMGLFIALGLLGLLGIQITLVNIIFVVFAICIAQDYSVFVVFDELRKNKTSTKPIMLSAFTTIAAFGSLALAKHPMLNGLGAASAISIFCALLSCVFVTPLLYRLLVGRKYEGKF